MATVEANSPNKSKIKVLIELLQVSTRLGLTSFGGPVAHLGYFHEEYVRRRKWMDERSYGDLVALCQFLPGPASSQVGMGIGIIRGGLIGGIVSWIGFTLPSVIALVLFAFLLKGMDISGAGWLHGLEIVAVAVVAQAIFGMGQKLAPDRSRITLAIAAAAVTLLWQTAFSQVAVIIAAGLLGVVMYRNSDVPAIHPMAVPVSRSIGNLCLLLFPVLLVALPFLRQLGINGMLPLFDSFYRAGALVFGGGHVVLPLLEKEVVPAGWVSRESFMAGYGAAQAVPGPLFTFAGYLGAMAKGISGAVIATVAIFLPAYLLIVGALPYWSILRQKPAVQGALTGVNAAVVGLLLAALYDPLWTTAILNPVDFVLAAVLFIMLSFWKLPPWIVAAAGAAGGTFIGYLSM
ncbi:chromate efflux transporter [Paenibacillus sepulcri]